MGKTLVEPSRERQGHHTYEVLVVLAGGVDQVERASGKTAYRPAPYLVEKQQTGYRKGGRTDSDNASYVVLGGHARAVAAAHLSQKGKVQTFLFSTGRPEYLSKHAAAPSEASVMRDETARRIGVRPPAESPTFFLEENSTNTRENAVESLKIVRQAGWKRIAVLSNEYHMRRVERFFEIAQEETQTRDVAIAFISAEEVLKERSPHYRALIERLEHSRAMRTRREWEATGIQALDEGQYSVPRR
jgi:uncharacterized SAM-binding protein YcdF (DUF218 family)